MYSKEQLKKAIKSLVKAEIVNNGIWFDVVYYDWKGNRHEHHVKYKHDPKLSLKERFTCDCEWWTHKVQFNHGQLCYHIIASIIKMVEEKWIDKFWLCPIFEVSVDNIKDMDITKRNLMELIK